MYLITQAYSLIGLLDGEVPTLKMQLYAIVILCQMWQRGQNPSHYDLAQQLMPEYQCR